jgi:tetratricopeptide (TPR) repeat protein/transcriptional regulator with XRE-family HTH domain
MSVAEPGVTFAQLLRQLRLAAGLTQQELAEAAKVSTRSVSDLERAINLTARKDTARLLADALKLTGAAREAFEATAAGRDGLAVGGAAGATRTLPRDIASFTGREAELRRFAGAATGAGGVVAIHAIGGMAGVGKTAFAVHAAHQLTPRFPDGQIFLPLHGHTPGQRPVDPADALASLLLTVGVSAAQIPPTVESRMALWRDRLAGKQMLLLLDDAVGSEQVRPLLPGSAGSLVLVTSRRHLTALEDAASISLDSLPPEEAARLFVRLAARPGLAPDDAAVDQLVRLCGQLPLAVGMLARQLHHHPAWSAADLATDLVATRDRLELMRAENVSVAAAFDLSYADLTADQKRLFRRLGLHPGTDIDAYVAAALDDTEPAIARRLLAALYDQYLLTEPARGRYRLHDLIREHARALAGADPVGEQEVAVDRLLAYYLHTARAANRHLAKRSPLFADDPGAPPGHAPDLATREDALAWMDKERPSLHAAVDYAAARDRAEAAVAIPAAMHGYLLNRGHWDQAATLHRIALSMAQQVNDRMGEAGALLDLSDAQAQAGDYPTALAGLRQALDQYRDLGSRLGEAHAFCVSGDVQRLTGDYEAAAASLTLALEAYRALDDRPGAASALNLLGAVRTVTGEYPAAEDSLTQAIGLYRELGDRRGEAAARNFLGAARYLAGDYAAAEASLTEAIGLFRELGDQRGEAGALTFLGDVRKVIGDYRGALAILSEALELYRSLGSRLGEANALNYLGAVQCLTEDFAAAARCQEQALGMYRDLGDRLGEANALLCLGTVRCLTGGYRTGEELLTQALDLYRDFGNRAGEAETLNVMGEQSLVAGDPAAARAHHEQALTIAVDIAAPLDEARALEGTGRCLLQGGLQDDQAAVRLREALAIYQRIGSPAAARVQQTLRDHGI